MVAHQAIAVGDSVRFTFGTTPVQGIVVDDRGPIGVNHAHIYGIRIPNDPYDDVVIELPEQDLALADAHVESISSEDAVNYFSHGGLVQILRSNLSGGKNQPRVWLRRDSEDNVIHTFIEERGVVGGAVVPFFALRDGRIFRPKLDEVSAFLSTFGLSADDIERVTRAVGTAR